MQSIAYRSENPAFTGIDVYDPALEELLEHFDSMPELREGWGYPAVLGLMAVVSLTTLMWFRRRGWLRRSKG